LGLEIVNEDSSLDLDEYAENLPGLRRFSIVSVAGAGLGECWPAQQRAKKNTDSKTFSDHSGRSENQQ